MDTLHAPDVISDDPEAATPYFLRRLAFSRAFDEAKQWYASGRPPGPPAA